MAGDTGLPDPLEGLRVLRGLSHFRETKSVVQLICLPARRLVFSKSLFISVICKRWVVLS